MDVVVLNHSGHSRRLIWFKFKFFHLHLVPGATAATVYWDPEHKSVLLKEGVLDKEGDAYGYFNHTLATTGWSVLEIRAGYGTTPETDELVFFLAGYLEGFLTAQYV